MSVPKAQYHHGDLRSALVGAATELARHGGPHAVVLRESARRVGVSQTAAYRHFADRTELVMAVAGVAQQGIASAMQVELDRIDAAAGSQQAAVAQLQAVGRGYVRFALAEPGLYATAFVEGHDKQLPEDADRGPYHLLLQALDDLVTVGLLDPEVLEIAASTAWAAVHGLSTLLLGPMSGVPADQLDGFIDACLGLVAYGLVSRSERPGAPSRRRLQG